jgi:hypothetical protein
MSDYMPKTAICPISESPERHQAALGRSASAQGFMQPRQTLLQRGNIRCSNLGAGVHRRAHTREALSMDRAAALNLVAQDQTDFAQILASSKRHLHYRASRACT